ncbi:MAG: peptide chain release factor N(5)-glutamine methyltransferase, partial [Gemmatimonadetes bacterium]|nr:peptide chain release factor N(5)-glutamine methyltransferase [Gemmatimonadota bacterium]
EVDRRVLIPRLETEGLVDHVLAWGRERRPGEDWGVAVDVGTGSGALALSLATEGRFARVIAIDVSPDALAVAARNRALVSPVVPVELRAGWWLEPVDAPVDVIVANPPYVTEAEFAVLEPSVRAFEPALALVAGADGLGPTRRIVEQARARLRTGGLLAVEVDSGRAGAALALAREAGFADARLAADWFGRDRYLLATGEAG